MQKAANLFVVLICFVCTSCCLLPTPPTTCTKKVVLTGYWPATNEMLRAWSTNPAQNPGPWIGQNWNSHGFDVYAFFPEFPPDGNPMNDPFGSDGWIGSPTSDLRVDYQDTSADFWRIMDTHQPHILITTSRGGSIGWEVEAVEGGHGGSSADPSSDWSSDRHGSETLPTQTSIDPRSWTAISTYRGNNTLPSQLPMNNIVSATTALNLENVQIDSTGTSGNYLSGFMALHGLYYNDVSPHNVAAGHIHVGVGVPTANAQSLMQATLDAVLTQYDADTMNCP
jgi:hypothetical protein